MLYAFRSTDDDWRAAVAAEAARLPDGCLTDLPVLLTNPAFLINPHIKKVGYDPLTSFEPDSHFERTNKALGARYQAPLGSEIKDAPPLRIPRAPKRMRVLLAESLALLR